MPKVADMDCKEMRRFALGGGNLTSPEAQKHLEDCGPCQALFGDGPDLVRILGEGPTASDAVRAPSLAAVEDEIARSRGWPSRLAELPTHSRWMLAALTLAVPVVVGILRHRHNLAEYPLARLVAELAALASVTVACCWLWIRPLFRRQPHPAASWIVASFALALPVALAALPPALPASAAHVGPGATIHRATSCLLFGSMMAMPAFLLLLGVGRRSTGPRGFSALPATAAALAGVFGLELHCPDTTPLHLIMGHASIVWLLPLLLMVVRQRSRRGASL
jgi:hypothetical protein